MFPIIRFHYDVMKKKYGENMELLFTHTDCLMYEFCTDHFYQDMWAMKEEFDFASSPKSSPFYDPTNNKVVVNFKNEASGQLRSEFMGLKPKMYSYQTLNDPSHGEGAFSTKKRAKGIQLAAVAKLRHEEYNPQLDQPQETYVSNRRIESKLHHIYGIDVWT